MTIFLGDFGSESSIVGSGDGLDVKSGCGRFSIKVLMWLYASQPKNIRISKIETVLMNV